MGASIFRFQELIGQCSHVICDCVPHGRDPDGCVNFIPKPKEETMPAPILSLADKLLAAIDDGLAHFGWPRLDHPVRNGVARRVARVMDESSALELCAAAHRAMSVADEWFCKYAHGIAFVDKAELIAKLTQAIEGKPAPDNPNVEEVAQCGVGADLHTAEIDKPVVERFCVIGVDAYQRAYYPTPAEAEAAAAKILASNIRRQATTSGVTPKKLLVVKAVSVIEPAPPIPPEHVVRAPTDDDFRTRMAKRSRPWEE